MAHHFFTNQIFILFLFKPNPYFLVILKIFFEVFTSHISVLVMSKSVFNENWSLHLALIERLRLHHTINYYS